MRSYSVTVASLAMRAPTKWLDNLISQHIISGIASARRGVSRRISYGALLHLTLARELHTELGFGVRDSLKMAGSLLEPGSGGVHHSGHLSVACDRAALEHDLGIRLRDALESAPAPPRGRPPRRGQGPSPSRPE